MPTLEQRKQILKEKRNFYTPIEKKNLEEHERNYDKLKNQKNEENKKNREQS